MGKIQYVVLTVPLLLKIRYPANMEGTGRVTLDVDELEQIHGTTPPPIAGLAFGLYDAARTGAIVAFAKMAAEEIADNMGRN